MSHKLTSNKSVVYNAQTTAASILTITPQSTNFVDNAGYQNGAEHTVQINGIVWANYNLINQTQTDRVNYTVDSTTWDAFVASQSLTATGSYNRTIEASLLYISSSSACVKEEIDLIGARTFSIRHFVFRIPFAASFDATPFLKT